MIICYLHIIILEINYFFFSDLKLCKRIQLPYLATVLKHLDGKGKVRKEL